MTYDPKFSSTPTELDPDKLFVGKITETRDVTDPYIALQEDVKSKIDSLKGSLITEFRMSDEPTYNTYLINLSKAISDLLDLKKNEVYVQYKSEEILRNNAYLNNRIKDMLNLCQIQFKYNQLRSELAEAYNYFDLSRAMCLKSEMVKMQIESIKLSKKDELIKKFDSPQAIFNEAIDNLLKHPNSTLLFNLLAYTKNKSAIPDKIQRIISNKEGKIEWKPEYVISVGEILTIFESMSSIFPDAVNSFQTLKESHSTVVRNLNKFNLNNLLAMEKSKYMKLKEFNLSTILFNNSFFTHDAREVFNNLKELKRMQMFAYVGISFIIQKNSGNEFKEVREELKRILGNYAKNVDLKKKYVAELSQLFPPGTIDNENARITTSYLVDISLKLLESRDYQVNKNDFNTTGILYF